MFREILSMSNGTHKLVGQFILGMVLAAMLIPGSAWAMERVKEKPGGDPPPVRSADILPKITESNVLGWQGTWQGVYTGGADSQYMVVRWKAIDQNRWMEGKMSFWPNQHEKTLLKEERIFVRPSSEKGVYRGYIIGSNDVMETGKAMVKKGIWDWTWTYSNGDRENSRMEYYAEGKMLYVGKVMDNDGQQVAQLDYNLSRPLPLTEQTTMTSPISHVTK